jgi:hypothetical protein
MSAILPEAPASVKPWCPGALSWRVLIPPLAILDPMHARDIESLRGRRPEPLRGPDRVIALMWDVYLRCGLDRRVMRARSVACWYVIRVSRGWR